MHSIWFPQHRPLSILSICMEECSVIRDCFDSSTKSPPPYDIVRLVTLHICLGNTSFVHWRHLWIYWFVPSSKQQGMRKIRGLIICIGMLALISFSPIFLVPSSCRNRRLCQFFNASVIDRRLAFDVLETLCCFLFESGSFACFTCNYSKTSNPCRSKWHMLSLAQKSSCGFV